MATMPKYVVTTGGKNFKFASPGGAYQNSAIAAELGITPVGTQKVDGYANQNLGQGVVKLVLHCVEQITTSAGASTRNVDSVVYCAAEKVATAITGLPTLTYNPVDPTTEAADGNKMTIQWVGTRRRRIFV
jgi:hypothetical protein